jgi:hypothetical protein
MILATLLSTTACASRASKIEPNFVSTAMYNGFSCKKLTAEARIVSEEAVVASGQQKKVANGDAVKTTVGVFIFWPTLFFNKGDGVTAANLANLKGTMQAIEKVSTQKKCGLNFSK